MIKTGFTVQELKEKLKVGHSYFIDNSYLIRVVEHRICGLGEFIMVEGMNRKFNISSLPRDNTIEEVKFPYSDDIKNAIETILEIKLSNVLDRIICVNIEEGKSRKEIVKE